MREYYSAYDNEYSVIKPSMESVMSAMGRAMWHFAQLKEMSWYCYGMETLTNALHGLEHAYGDYIDSFKALLKQLGLPLVYPTINGMIADARTIPEMLDYAVWLIDDVNKALSDFIETTDNEKWEPLARQAESIQITNYEPRAWLTQARTMAGNNVSVTSFDNWLSKIVSVGQ